MQKIKEYQYSIRNNKVNKPVLKWDKIKTNKWLICMFFFYVFHKYKQEKGLK